MSDQIRPKLTIDRISPPARAVICILQRRLERYDIERRDLGDLYDDLLKFFQSFDEGRNAQIEQLTHQVIELTSLLPPRPVILSKPADWPSSPE